MKIESDDGIARELQHEVAKRPDRDLRCHRSPFFRRSLRMAVLHFGQRRFDQFVDQVVRLDAQTFTSRHLDVRPRLVLFGKCDAQLDAGSRRSATISYEKWTESSACSSKTERAQTRYHDVLQIGLAGIDDIEDRAA